MKRLIAAIVPVALALASCAGAREAPEPELQAEDIEFVNVALEPGKDLQSLVNSAHRIGRELVIHGEPGENVISSPVSLILALGMLAEGASDNALTEIESAIGVSGDKRSETMAAVIRSLREFDGDVSSFNPEKELGEEPFVHVANQLVVDDDFTPEGDFLINLKRFHDSGIALLDLSDESSIEPLSVWVRHHTAGLIRKTSIVPNNKLRLVMQNAVLFASRWSQPFDEQFTKDHPFYTLDGQTIDVPMMDGEIKVNLGEKDGWRLASIPYRQRFVATVVLPPEGVDPADMTDELLAGLIADAATGRSQKTIVMLPRLDLESKLDLVESLEALGVTKIFDPEADPLHRTCADEVLIVDQMSQQARLKVREDGTIAAAVTEVGEAGEVRAPEEPELFIVDRPYLFLVHDNESGLPLFYSAIRNPIAQ